MARRPLLGRTARARTGPTEWIALGLRLEQHFTDWTVTDRVSVRGVHLGYRY